MTPTCTSVHFLHVVKCGGTTIRGWMRELVTRDGFEFASHYDVASCVPKNASNRHACWEPQVAAATRTRAGGRERQLAGAPTAPRVALAQPPIHVLGEPVDHPIPPAFRSRGCRVVLAMMLREPLSLYRSWHRYISTQGWGRCASTCATAGRRWRSTSG